jgi:ribonuclease HI
MGMGVVVRNNDGMVLVALAEVTPHITDLTTAEAVAARRVVTLCRGLGFLQVVFEGDSSLVVSALRTEAPTWSLHGNVIEDARIRL